MNAAQFILPPPLGTSNDIYNAFPATGADLNGLPSLPSLGSGQSVSARIQNAFSSITGGSGAGSSAAAASPTATSATPAQGGSANPGTSDVASAALPGSIQNYFTRAVVIVMGFIFLAVGLNMLRPGTVPNPVKAV